MIIKEGYMPYLGYQTYYRIVGENTGNKKPIILLHGGPGSTHNYFELLDCIAQSGRQVISYDQLGCGNSYVEGHEELWNMDTWENELCELIKHLGLTKFHLLGQSWGGMLLLNHLLEKDQSSVCSAILSSTLSSSKLWGIEQHRMISYMSKEDQDAIQYAEENNAYDSEEYLAANGKYMQLHCAGPFTKDDPECLTRKKKAGTLSYVTAWGPNEYTPLGTLKDFDVTNRLNEIQVPSLIFSGTDDLCTPLVAKTMYDGIPNSTWHLMANARHMCFADQHDTYCKILEEWLEHHD